MPKSKERISTDESDSEEEVKTKKAKVDKKPAAKAARGNDDKFELGKMRYINVNEFKGKQYVNIREYYLADDGEERPGKKGISLTVEQWEKLKGFIADVDAKLK